VHLARPNFFLPDYCIQIGDVAGGDGTVLLAGARVSEGFVVSCLIFSGSWTASWAIISGGVGGRGIPQ